MVVIIEGAGAHLHPRLFQAMFEDRKRVFVDLLKWDVPVVGGRFEQDVFDDKDATYLVALDGDGAHAGSLRLLPTVKPHILSDLFASLCDGELPQGETIFEITRLCLPARYGAAKRLAIRNQLISAMVDHSLGVGIDTLTGVVEAGFLAKVLDMGWRCSALGELKRFNNKLLGAFRLDIEEETPKLLARKRIYTTGTIVAVQPEQAAA
jgi:acyl-homoserine lactone synthase